MKTYAVKTHGSKTIFDLLIKKTSELGYYIGSYSGSQKQWDKYSSFPYLIIENSPVLVKHHSHPETTLDEFMALKPEDVQDYKPKSHVIIASDIKKLLDVDARDIIILED